ncbi:MAG: hypothetical protein AAGC74_07060 [Verrucomicrobiota bacterium]
MPTISNILITDISPKSFRVVWDSSLNSVPDLEVFLNASATVPAIATLQPFAYFGGETLASNEASAEGLQSILVSGLSPNTTYYFRVRSSNVAGDQTNTSSLLSVQTSNTAALSQAIASNQTPFANPLLAFDLLSEDGSETSPAAIYLADVPGSRSPIAVSNSLASRGFFDLNHFVSASNGLPLPVTQGTPLQIIIRSGNNRTKILSFFTPENQSLAKTQSPQLTPDNLLKPAIMSPSGQTGPSRVFLEFPVSDGQFYQIERSSELQPGQWQNVSGGLQASGPRLFWEDNILAETNPAPSESSRFFYRITTANTGADGPLTAYAVSFGILRTNIDVSENSDNDAAVLLEEYAYNLNPTISDSSTLPQTGPASAGLPCIWIEQNANQITLRYRFVRRTTPDNGLTYKPEYTADLSSTAWPEASGNESTTTINSDYELVDFSSPLGPVSSNPKVFARLNLFYTAP